MSSYEIDQFETAPTEDCVCSICRSVFESPRSTPCGHTFCQRCIEMWLERSQTCPACRGAVSPNDLSAAPPVLASVLDSLRLYCTHRANGCGCLLRLGQYREHVADCFYLQVRCCWGPKCPVSVRRDQRAAHEVECPHRKERCTRGCSLMVGVAHAANHVCMLALEHKIQKLEGKTQTLEAERSRLQSVIRNLEEERSNLERRHARLTQQLREMQALRAASTTSRGASNDNPGNLGNPEVDGASVRDTTENSVGEDDDEMANRPPDSTE